MNSSEKDWEEDGAFDDSDDDSDEFDDDDHTAACPYCGADIADDTPRCPHCGEYISEEDAPRAPLPTLFIVGLIAAAAVVAAWAISF